MTTVKAWTDKAYRLMDFTYIEIPIGDHGAATSMLAQLKESGRTVYVIGNPENDEEFFEIADSEVTDESSRL